MNANELAAKLLRDYRFNFLPPEVKVIDPHNQNQAIEIESVSATPDGKTILIQTKI